MMMLLKYNSMVKVHEAVSGNGGIKLALGSLLIAVGISVSGCAEGSAQSVKPQEKEVTLVASQEARAFASLPRHVQSEIRAAYAKCMVEVDEFAEDASGGDVEMKQVLYDDGLEDCDSIRNSEIRSAKAKQNMDERTARITSG